MRFLGLIAFLLFLHSCQVDTYENDCSRNLDRIIAELARQARKEGLILSGSGGGLEGEYIREICVSFDTYSVLSVDEARKLVVRLSDQLTQIIRNKNSYESCFLSSVPLVDRFSISIFGSSPKDKNHSYITSVVKHNNEVLYSKFDRLEPARPSEDVHQETFAEAEAIVKGE